LFQGRVSKGLGPLAGPGRARPCLLSAPGASALAAFAPRPHSRAMSETDASGAAAPSYSPEQIAALFLDALRRGDVALAGQMLDAGIDREAPDPRGFPPLVIAAYAGQEAAVALLLGHGARVDARDARGNTALLGVAFKGYEAVARRLLDGGAAVDAANGSGQTALMVAAAFRREAIVDLLLAAGASTTLRDERGETAAELARGMGGNAALADRLG